MDNLFTMFIVLVIALLVVLYWAHKRETPGTGTKTRADVLNELVEEKQRQASAKKLYDILGFIAENLGRRTNVTIGKKTETDGRYESGKIFIKKTFHGLYIEISVIYNAKEVYKAIGPSPKQAHVYISGEWEAKLKGLYADAGVVKETREKNDKAKHIAETMANFNITEEDLALCT